MAGTSTLLKLTIIGWCVMSTDAIFATDELEAILSSLKLLKMANCILSTEKVDETVKDAVRELNRNFVLTGFVRADALGVHLRGAQPPDALTAVVVKVETSSAVREVFVENYKRLNWFIWFLITSDDLDDAIRIPFDCQLYKIQKDVNRSLRLIEIYHVKNSSAYTNEFGVWTPERGLNAAKVDMYIRRSDLRGIELKVLMRKMYIGETTMNEFWRDSARILNFTLIEKDPNLKLNPEEMDGTTYMWGLTGGEERRDWIFFSFGLKVKLAVKFCGTNEVGWRAYIQPFTPEIWTAIGLWLFLSTVAIIVVNGCDGRAIYLNIFTSFFCLCNSDPMVTHSPSRLMTISTKLVYLMSLAVPAVIIPGYSAYILSTLSIILPLEPFHDLKSFIEDGTYKLVLVNRSFGERYFKTSNDPDIKYINDNLLVGPKFRPKDYSELFQQLCRDVKLTGLFIDTEPYRRLFQCQVFVVQPEMMTITVGIQLPKKSPIKKILNEKFAQYHERGLKGKQGPKKDQKYAEEEANRLRALNMSQMRAIFLLIPLGAILCLIVLVFELTVLRAHKARNARPKFSNIRPLPLTLN